MNGKSKKKYLQFRVLHTIRTYLCKRLVIQTIEELELMPPEKVSELHSDTLVQSLVPKTKTRILPP